MRIGRTARWKVAVALCGALATGAFLRGDDSSAKPAKPPAATVKSDSSKTNAPAKKAAPIEGEKIEFSGPSNVPNIPKPGSRTEDVLKQFGNVRESSTPSGPDFG